MIGQPQFNIYAREHARRRVRRVVQEESELADAIFTIAAGDRIDWDLSDWEDVLAELDACDKTVGDWLKSCEVPA